MWFPMPGSGSEDQHKVIHRLGERTIGVCVFTHKGFAGPVLSSPLGSWRLERLKVRLPSELQEQETVRKCQLLGY